MRSDEFHKYVRTNEKGRLEVEGWDCATLAEKFGTPVFVISENTIRSNYRRLAEALRARYAKFRILYSVKANYGLAVRKILQREGAGEECHGLGELYTSLLIGTDPAKISLDGINKSEEEMRLATESGATVVIESLEELENLDKVASDLGRFTNVGFRVRTSTVEIEDKSGLDFGTALEAAKRALQMQNVRPSTIMVHSGGQLSVEDFVLEAEEMMDFVATLKNELKWEPGKVDLGSGLPTWRAEGYGPPPSNRSFPPVEDYAEEITSMVRKKMKQHALSEPTLVFETGRYLVANAGILLSRVGLVKELPIRGWRKKVCVDASVNLLMRIATSDYYHHVVAATKVRQPAEEVVDVVGTTGFGCHPDILGKSPLKLPKLGRGDLVAVLDAGAYAESTTTQYLVYPRPATILLSKNKAEIVRRAESVQDVVALDQIPYRLLVNRIDKE